MRSYKLRLLHFLLEFEVMVNKYSTCIRFIVFSYLEVGSKVKSLPMEKQNLVVCKDWFYSSGMKGSGKAIKLKNLQS